MRLPFSRKSGEATQPAGSPHPRKREARRDRPDGPASDLIESARRNAERFLDLSDMRLEEVPKEIRELRQLEHLSLYRNAIRVVPEWLRELPNLKHLDIAFNPVYSVPDVADLTLDWNTLADCRETLSALHVSGLYIITGRDQVQPEEIRDEENLAKYVTALPALSRLYIGLRGITHRNPLNMPKPSAEILALLDRLSDCRQLASLSLFGVLLDEVPPSIRGLKRLEQLHLTGAGLRKLPKWLSELHSLRGLGASMCELQELPKELAELRSLNYVYLSENRFAEFPPVLLQIPTLRVLSLRASKSAGYEGLIRETPSHILDLPELEKLDVEGQPIETPPPEVVTQGVEAIKNYWRQQKEGGVDYLCEAKLLIVGEAGAGKTSLAKKIVDKRYTLKPGEPSTEGIEVLQWRFPTAVRINQGGTQQMLDRDFRVNIWDFGGQEIYHATHQFFLTRRSMYALVVDDRKEDTDFNYWLQIVELLSDASPLVIVQNEKQDRRRDINIASLRARFPNLKATYQTNLATNRGLEQLLGAVQQELEHLPHIGIPMPRTWRLVREALESDQRNYIGLEEYLAICDRHGFQRREDKLQLSGYLHDLGICLHFQDDAVLKSTLILKPRWGTAAVYGVLDDRAVIDNRGRFADSDLARIWSKGEYAVMRQELLRLMQRFELCYRLHPEGEHIAPQLLSPLQPQYEWREPSGITVRYEYDFMPKGLMTRLIVSLHHLIADQSFVWRSGVIFERQGTRAEVIEDYPRRKITVRVAGADNRGMLAIIDDQLERIHGSFSRLRYEKFLPCNCQVCCQKSEPFAYPLTALVDFASTGDSIQCHFSRKLVDASALIRDVFPGAPALHELPAGGSFVASCDSDKHGGGEVFVSYAWSDISNDIVDRLGDAFARRNITIIRDRNELRYKDPIRDFMKRLGRGKCIVIVLSKKYLESKSCMFELTEISAAGDVRDRVFPIILDDAKIYDAMGRLAYIRYWENRRMELNAEIKHVSGEYLTSIHDELDLCAKVRATIDGIMDLLAGMNCLTPEQHRGSSFLELIESVSKRLLE